MMREKIYKIFLEILKRAIPSRVIKIEKLNELEKIDQQQAPFIIEEKIEAKKFQFEADPLKRLICTQGFGKRPEYYAPLGSPRGHNGLDFRTWVNNDPTNWKQDIYSVMSGRILEAREDTIYGKGNYVRIDHGSRGQTVYLHLSEIKAIEGNSVIAGERIGISGNSGSASEAPHLHFSYKQAGFDKDNGYMGCSDPSEYFVGDIAYLEN